MAATAAQLANILPYFPAKDLSAFHVESLLGGGGFSHVVLARDGTGKDWALKLIPAPGASSLDDVDSAPLLLTEARIHLLVSGEPSVLPCMEAFKSVYVPEGGGGGHATFMAVLRMPVAACSVEEWLFSASPVPQACQGTPKSQVDEDEALTVWLQMVNAVHRCHAHGIIHKDIKLPNFLMDGRGKVQIMDFGLAQVEGVTPRAVAGTPWTMSPAGLKHGDDGRAGDWWALGVVLYQLLQGGSWPFKHCWWPWQKGGGERMEAAIRRAVLAGRITFQGGGSGHVSEPLRALIRGLLQSDPNRRWQLRQVLASEAVRPELLARLGERFPDLQPDMQALLQLQRRAREVQAVGSDGGVAAAAPAAAAAAVAAAGAAAAAGLATAGSLLVAKASTVLRAGASSLVPEGGLHWPHWPAGGAGGGGGDDVSSYRPLLDGEEREGEVKATATPGEVPARHSGPQPALGSGSGPGMARRLSWGPVHPGDAAPPQPARGPAEQSRQQQPQSQRQADGARVADLLLLFPNEVPDAHPSPPGTPQADSLPQAAIVGATAQASAPGLGPASFGRRSDQERPTSGRGPSGGGAAAGLTSPVSSAAAGVSASLHHAYTTSLTARTGSDIAARGPSDTSASGPTADAGDGGAAEGRRTGSHPHTPRLSRRSLTQGSPRRGPSQLGAMPGSPVSPRSRRSRTSLQDLFGSPSNSLPLQGQTSVQPHPHAHQRPLSGAAMGGLLGTAAEYLSGGGGAAGHHHHHHHHHLHRSSWALPRRSMALMQPLDPGAEGEEAESGILSQSSWVPPPPEAIAAAAAAATAAAAAAHRLGSGDGRATAAGAGTGPGGGSPHAQARGLQPRHSQHHHGGLLDRARRLFSACLQRPGVKYDMYDGYEYDALPAPTPAGKAP